MSRVLLALLLVAAAHAGEADRALLEAQGVGCDAPSLDGYLRGLCPGERERAEAMESVRELGADDPVTRHEALLKLSALTVPPLFAIRKATASSDTEVRRVGARLLEESLGRIRKDILRAILQTIADDEVKGLAEAVLGVAALATELHLDPAVERALRATLQDGDIAALRLAAASDDLATSCIAVRALGAAPGAGPDEAAPFLEAADERMRLAAALALADRGDRRCFPALLATLEARDPHVRRRAAEALRVACGGGAGYDPFAAPEAERAAIEAWRKWVEARRESASWEHPLPVGNRQLGRTLISLFTQKRVVEVDAEAHRTFELNGLEGPWAIQGLPNGHRLIALHTRGEIVEYDAEGREISRLRLPGRPGGFRRLDNGNTLVAIADQMRVVEVKPDGAIAHEVGLRGYPMDVQHLENGHLLVLVSRPAAQVIEVDREGKVCWSLDGIGRATTVQRLDNGNTLLAETNGPQSRAVEYDRTGQVVWEKAGLQQCYSAERLPDGSTLIADQGGVREVAQDGTERWLFKASAFARASRY